jgi:Mn-dependent DtxR family transcriptional regulator
MGYTVRDTIRQFLEILVKILDMNERGSAPTIGDIAGMAKTHRSVVSRYIRAMQDLGIVEAEALPGVPRRYGYRLAQEAIEIARAARKILGGGGSN